MNNPLVQRYLPRVLTAFLIVLFASFLHFSFNQNAQNAWYKYTTSYVNAADLAFTAWAEEQAKELDSLTEKKELSGYLTQPKDEASLNSIKVLLKQFSYITGIKNLYIYAVTEEGVPLIQNTDATPLAPDFTNTLADITKSEPEKFLFFTGLGDTPYFVIGEMLATELGSPAGYAFYLMPAEAALKSLGVRVFGLARSSHMHFQIHQKQEGLPLTTLSFEKDGIKNYTFPTHEVSPLRADLMRAAGHFKLTGAGTVIMKSRDASHMPHLAFSSFIAKQDILASNTASKVIIWVIAALLSIAIIAWPGEGPIEMLRAQFFGKSKQVSKKLGKDSRTEQSQPQLRTGEGLKLNTEIVDESKRESKDIKKQKHVVAYNIKTALKEGRFALLYQPIVDTNTNMPIMYEVFSRIIDANDNVLTPDIFMPIALKENLVHFIDQGAINTVFDRHLKSSAQQINVPLSVNLSGDTFENIAFLEDFMKKITGKNAHLSEKIVFELNSREIIEDKNVMKFIRECHSMGVRFAFDYFGGGASTIKAAKALKLDFVKVNAFHFPITDKEKLKELIIIAKTAEKVGVPLIAERVEDPHFIAICKKIGITRVQGFGIAKPSANPTYKPEAKSA